jgi:hypothetical protein
MKKLIFLFVSILVTSCTLHSTTYIKANESFVLGNNKHGRFSVKLKNTSKNSLEIWKMHLEGGQHSPKIVQPNETVHVKINSESALRILNNTTSDATVELLVKGDTNLSMGYKN